MLRALRTIVATAVLSAALHLALGWMWTPLAGVAAGLWRPPSGWWLGAGGVALGWGSLVGYTAAVAPGALHEFIDTVGALGGNIPGETVVGATLMVGALLGAAGGGFGSLLALLLPLCRPHKSPQHSPTQ